MRGYEAEKLVSSIGFHSIDQLVRFKILDELKHRILVLLMQWGNFAIHRPNLSHLNMGDKSGTRTTLARSLVTTV